LRSLQSSLLTDVTYAISGNNGLVNLSSIGVKMENDGTLSIDSGELNDAIANNFADVQNLFQATGDTNGWAVNFMKDLAALTDTTSGAVNVELTQNAASQKDISRQISDIEDRLTARQQVLIQQYSQVDTLLREYPIMMSQINSELATLPSNTKSS
jgi:flagellar hook-associated protein 2